MECERAGSPYYSDYETPSQLTKYSWSGSVPEAMLDSGLYKSPRQEYYDNIDQANLSYSGATPKCPLETLNRTRNISRSPNALRGGADSQVSTLSSTSDFDFPNELPMNLSSKLSESDFEPATDTDVTIPGEEVCPMIRPSFLQRFDKRAEREIDFYKKINQNDTLKIIEKRKVCEKI